MNKEKLKDFALAVLSAYFVITIAIYFFIKWTDEIHYVRSGDGVVIGLERPPHKGESMENYIFVKKGTTEFELLKKEAKN